MRVEGTKYKKREITFDEIRNGTIFDMVENRGNYFMKAGDVYSIDMQTGGVVQPLMLKGTAAELYQHLYIYPHASLKV